MSFIFFLTELEVDELIGPPPPPPASISSNSLLLSLSYLLRGGCFLGKPCTLTLDLPNNAVKGVCYSPLNNLRSNGYLSYATDGISLIVD